MKSPVETSVKRTVRALLGVAVALLLPSLSPADSEGELVSVTATGYGETVAEAKKDAGRAAIERVVGKLQDTETLDVNDELDDRILTYSGAFLEDLEVVGKPVRRKSTGLVEVTVRATVRRTQPAKKPAAENGSKAKVRKEKLFAQALSRQQEADDAGAMLAAAFEGFPGNVLRFAVCKNADGTPAVSVDSAEGDVSVDVSLGIDPAAWKDWSEGLAAKLAPMASGSENGSWEVAWTDGDSPFRLHDGYLMLWNEGIGHLRSRWKVLDDTPGFRVALVSSVRRSASACRAREFVFSGNNEKAVRDAIWKRMAEEVRLTVSLMADDELLQEKTVRLRATPGALLFAKWGGGSVSPGNSSICLLPAIGTASAGSGSIVTLGRFTIPLGRVSQAAIADATGVETSVRFFALDEKGYDFVPLDP